jgi:cytochrome c-type biogenesis protein CcmH
MVAAFAIVFAISRSRGDQAPDTLATTAAGTGDIISDLEAKTRANPKDAAAWQQLGMAYFESDRFADAARSYQTAAELDPGQAIVWSALGEARVMASERDPMPTDAAEAFERALTLDSKDPRARYFLAVRKDLANDHEGAIADWLALLEDTPADAPWRADLIRTIEQVGKIHEIEVTKRLADAGAKSPPAARPVAAQAIPGPSAQDLASAANIRPAEQQQMAEGMVARLEQRLQTEPGNVDGWIMLMRSRMVLEQPAQAQKALADALKANPAKADYLRQQAAILGIK